jgi:hypothetical protein
MSVEPRGRHPLLVWAWTADTERGRAALNR